ncbi:Uu.00g037140.m01.CDS01 [Anthostomella pinea]|uniref:Uu.00g037140.m01.CDS01 n=1 Tax=Anthostomella pinea TaxID=933095 RepID=A0AAI8VAL0_9PEZI|nr:Uu.00g037140.m01.CDS01 [Anthostomella pinea]
MSVPNLFTPFVEHLGLPASIDSQEKCLDYCDKRTLEATRAIQTWRLTVNPGLSYNYSTSAGRMAVAKKCLDYVYAAGKALAAVAAFRYFEAQAYAAEADHWDEVPSCNGSAIWPGTCRNSCGTRLE